MTRDEAIKWLDVIVAHLNSQKDEPFPEALENIKKFIQESQIDELKEQVEDAKKNTSVDVPDSWLDRCSNNGYERYIDKNGDRRYCDNNEPVGDNPFRPCAKCGGMPNEYGDDHCIQRLGNVMNACCGHGNRMGYIQFDSGHLIEGYFTVKVKQPNGEYL